MTAKTLLTMIPLNNTPPQKKVTLPRASFADTCGCPWPCLARFSRFFIPAEYFWAGEKKPIFAW